LFRVVLRLRAQGEQKIFKIGKKFLILNHILPFYICFCLTVSDLLGLKPNKVICILAQPK
jgi:hypothetical protein